MIITNYLLENCTHFQVIVDRVMPLTGLPDGGGLMVITGDNLGAAPYVLIGPNSCNSTSRYLSSQGLKLKPLTMDLTRQHSLAFISFSGVLRNMLAHSTLVLLYQNKKHRSGYQSQGQNHINTALHAMLWELY